MSPDLKYGLIGAGSSAGNIATSLKTIDHAKLIAIAAKTKEEAAALEDKLDEGVICENYENLLKIEEIDAVIISVPHSLHHPITMAALKAGKHVLCEKPLAVTMEQGNEMIAAAKEKNLKLGTFFQMRFDDAAQKAKEIVEDGTLGQLLHAQVNVMWYRDQDYYDNSPWRGKWATEGGGSLINQSCHSIDLMTWLVGKPKTVFGVFGAKTHKIEVDDNSAAVVLFDNDVYASIQTSTSLQPGYSGKINLYGSKGSISLVGNSLTHTKEDGTVDTLDFGVKQVGSANDPKKFSLKSQQRMLLDFTEAVQKDRSPEVDGFEGMRAVEIIRAIYESNGEKVIKF